METTHYEIAWEAYREQATIDRFMRNPMEIHRFRTVCQALSGSTTSLLDVGCGPGFFLHMLSEWRTDIQTVGVERSEQAVALARKLFDVAIEHGDSANLPFDDNAFDVVTALEVIEHLPYGVYEQALQEMQRVARKHIIMSVPYKEERLFVTCPYCGCQFNPDFHMRTFDEQKVVNLFSTFELTDTQRVGLEFQVPRLVRRMYHVFYHGGFAEFGLVCPVCGYQQSARAGEQTSDAVHENRFSAHLKEIAHVLKRQAKMAVPLVKTYRWLIASYQHIS